MLAAACLLLQAGIVRQFAFYPAATPMKQAYWNVSANTWGGSVYNDSGTCKLSGSIWVANCFYIFSFYLQITCSCR